MLYSQMYARRERAAGKILLCFLPAAAIRNILYQASFFWLIGYWIFMRDQRQAGVGSAKAADHAEPSRFSAVVKPTLGRNSA
jgi:hypothetical protein